jgi:ABC-2 type transport system permease protein
VRPTALLAGKILAMGLLALLQIVALAGTFVFLLSQAGNVFDQLGSIDIDPVSLAIMSVYFVLGFLLFGSFMAAIGALSTSVRESQNFVIVVTLPAAVPFFFLSLFAEEPNGTLALALSMFPLTAPLSMTMRVAITDVPVGQLALSLFLLVLGVMFAIWLAGRLFRVNTLLAGNMPRLRDLPRLLLRG